MHIIDSFEQVYTEWTRPFNLLCGDGSSGRFPPHVVAIIVSSSWENFDRVGVGVVGVVGVFTIVNGKQFLIVQKPIR